jgi:hypothetical protein
MFKGEELLLKYVLKVLKVNFRECSLRLTPCCYGAGAGAGGGHYTEVNCDIQHTPLSCIYVYV